MTNGRVRGHHHGGVTGRMTAGARPTGFRRLGGWIALLMVVAVLSATCAEYPSLPRIVAGTISTDQAGSTRPLTSLELTTISDWLAEHHAGWATNVATSPAGTIYISLDAAAQPAAVRLTLWPGPKFPGWNGAVLLEVSAEKTILIQRFSDRDLAPIVRLAVRARE